MITKMCKTSNVNAKMSVMLCFFHFFVHNSRVYWTNYILEDNDINHHNQEALLNYCEQFESAREKILKKGVLDKLMKRCESNPQQFRQKINQ